MRRGRKLILNNAPQTKYEYVLLPHQEKAGQGPPTVSPEALIFWLTKGTVYTMFNTSCLSPLLAA